MHREEEKTHNKKTIIKKTDFTNNNFLYFNNATNKFEGVSMHSSYSVLKLNRIKNFTLITTTSSPFNQSIVVPLYHQFIYTIKISSSSHFDLIEILNEQNIDSSRFRVGLIRQVSEQLGLSPSHIRINWIEKLNKSEIDLLNDNLNSNEFDLHDLDQEDQEEYENEQEEEEEEQEEQEEQDIDDSNYKSKDKEYNYEVEPQFISELTQYSIEKISSKNQPNLKSYYYILISFSDTNLLELQKTYFLLKKSAHDLISKNKQEQIKSKYENDCRNYFKLIKQKHQELFKQKEKRFQFSLNNQTNNNNNYFNEKKDSEKIKKVQLLKFCDLNQLNNVLVTYNENEKSKQQLNNSDSRSIITSLLSNTLNLLIKNSTEEINYFQNSKLVDYEINNLQDTVNSSETTFVEDNTNNNIDDTRMETTAQVTLLKSSSANINQTNSTTITTLSYYNLVNDFKAWFWTVIPEEDLLLAVIVPCTVILSMIVMTIVVICLIQMCNDEKSAKHLKSISNNSSQSTHLALSTTLEKPPPTYYTNTMKSIYKEKAYLSKGVPVILYEEMGDKPIDDYDENHRDIMDSPSQIGTYRSIKSNYPSTLRNEKPAAPAPPEYIRHPTLKNKLFNNNNNSILQQLVDSTDESSSLIRMPYSFDEENHRHHTLFYEPPQPIAGLKDILNMNENDDKKNLIISNVSSINSIQQQKQQLNFMLP